MAHFAHEIGPLSLISFGPLRSLDLAHPNLHSFSLITCRIRFPMAPVGAEPLRPDDSRGAFRGEAEARAIGKPEPPRDRKSTRLNSSHGYISYAVFCLKKKNVTS